MTLDIGSRGDSVRSLQRSLNAAGVNSGKADGIFGAKTEAAVRQYQSQHGLQVDGRVGKDTTRALQAERNRDSFEAAPRTNPNRTQAAEHRPGERPYQELTRFANDRGFTVTSTTGGHHLGRGHREGRAADVRTRDHTPAQVEQFMREARAAGYWVNDERTHGNSARTGPHVHIEIR